MWKFMSKFFMTMGVLGAIGSMMYLWGYFIPYSKAGMVLTFVCRFLRQFLIAAASFALGDHMGRIQSEKNTMKKMFNLTDNDFGF